jgi:hypothetical protein
VGDFAVHPVEGEDFDALLHSAALGLAMRRSGAPVRR